MLTAVNQSGIQILARDADKCQGYVCPMCKDAVILKKGRIKIPHFAHHPSSQCSYGTGESAEHYTAKLIIHDWLALYKVPSRIEYPTSYGSRPDVYLRWKPLQGLTYTSMAVEIQKSCLSIDDSRSRTCKYFNNNTFPLWLVLEGKIDINTADRITYTPWLAYLDRVYRRGVFYITPTGKIHIVRFDKHWLHKSEYTDRDGTSYGGYDYESTRWRTPKIIETFKDPYFLLSALFKNPENYLCSWNI